MNDKKKLQRKLDRMGKKKGNTADVSDGRKEINEFIQDNGRPGQKRRAQKLNDKINPSYQGVAPIKGMSDEQAKSIDEDYYPPTSRKSALNMLGIKSPLNFKGANSSNSSCWKGYKKVGTKKSPSGTGETVNDCKKI
jgi:hypothetical protein